MEATLALGIIDDEEPDEGCEFVVFNITTNSGNGSVVQRSGIHDVGTVATIRIAENDFASSVLERSTDDAHSGGGGLSPASAKVGATLGFFSFQLRTQFQRVHTCLVRP